MGLIITPQEQIDAYFESDRLGQSTLKGLLKGFDSFMWTQANQNQKELHYEEKDFFIIGSAVDCLLTGEEGDFRKLYYTSQCAKKPSDVEMSMVHQVFDEMEGEGVFEDGNNRTIELKDCVDAIKQAITDHNWQARWKMETKVEKVIEAGSEYFEDLVRGVGKQVISLEENAKIHNIVNSLRTNRRTRRFFDRATQENTPNVDFYYQLVVEFEYEGVACKALMDLVVVIKNEAGEIIQIAPYDLKTMHGNCKYFLSSVKKRRYDIQAAWYTNALSKHFYTRKELISNFKFIVESSSSPGRPLVFILDDSLMEIGQSGKPSVRLIDTQLFDEKQQPDAVLQKEVWGIDQLIQEYKYHMENDWTEDREIAERDGVLTINWEGIVDETGDR